MLHLDPAAQYGTHWAGLRLDQFLEWAHSLPAEPHLSAAAKEHSPPDTASLDTSPRCATAPATTMLLQVWKFLVLPGSGTEMSVLANAGSGWRWPWGCRSQQWLRLDCVTARGSGLPRTQSWAPPAATTSTSHPRHAFMHIPLCPVLSNTIVRQLCLEDMRCCSNAWRGCCIVLQVAFCGGPLVQTLLRSGAHNYVDFKLLQGRCVQALLLMAPTKAVEEGVICDMEALCSF